MALMKCPECKKKISDQCENCPNCGYPIGKICKINESQTTDIENIDETIAKNPKSIGIKSLLKKWWFWVAVGAVIVAVVTTTLLLLNRDTKPKFDKDGNPMFVELTNEVYTNAEDYLGYHINIKGEVFQVMGESGNVKGIQVWLDPDTCEQNLMIYYNTDAVVKQGDYIMCTAYIDSVHEYKNAYDAKRHAPLVVSEDLKKSTYMEVVAPTKEVIVPENLKHEKYGYSVSVDKVEFAEKETRVYVSATNNGKSTLHFGDAVIVQDGKQYNPTSNYEAGYDEIPYQLVKGVSSSGIILFPAVSTNDFELTIDISSDNYGEDCGEFTFVIGKFKTDILDFGYRAAVQTMINFYNGEQKDVAEILPQELWEYISQQCNVTAAEAEMQLEYMFVELYDYRVESFEIKSEERLSQADLKKYLDGINHRYNGLNLQSLSDGYKLTVEVTAPNGKRTIYKPTMVKIDNNWYWTESEETNYPYFHTGFFTPAA